MDQRAERVFEQRARTLIGVPCAALEGVGDDVGGADPVVQEGLRLKVVCLQVRLHSASCFV